VSAVRWVGVALIVIGAGFISYSEHAKPGRVAAPAAAEDAPLSRP
jgi:hypothetical protein